MRHPSGTTNIGFTLHLQIGVSISFNISFSFSQCAKHGRSTVWLNLLVTNTTRAFFASYGLTGIVELKCDVYMRIYINIYSIYMIYWKWGCVQGQLTMRGFQLIRMYKNTVDTKIFVKKSWKLCWQFDLLMVTVKVIRKQFLFPASLASLSRTLISPSLSLGSEAGKRKESHRPHARRALSNSPNLALLPPKIITFTVTIGRSNCQHKFHDFLTKILVSTVFFYILISWKLRIVSVLFYLLLKTKEYKLS